MRMRPVGTPEKRLRRSSLQDLEMFGCNPSVETLGYSHPSLRDEELQILVALDLVAGGGEGRWAISSNSLTLATAQCRRIVGSLTPSASAIS